MSSDSTKEDAEIDLDTTMERTNIYMPRWLDRLLTIVSLKEGDGKGKLLRNAMLRELDKYVEVLEQQDTPPCDPILKSRGDPKEIMADAEESEQWVRALYSRLLSHDPQRIRAIRRVQELGVPDKGAEERDYWARVIEAGIEALKVPMPGDER